MIIDLFAGMGGWEEGLRLRSEVLDVLERATKPAEDPFAGFPKF